MRPERLVTSVELYQAQRRIADMDSLKHLFLSFFAPIRRSEKKRSTWYNMTWALGYGDMDSDIFVRMMEYAIECCRKANDELGAYRYILFYGLSLLERRSINEIALTLGISKNGVGKAHSRMRQRMELKSEVVLEEFLRNIFTTE